jgi:hypothetical protein
MTGDLRYVHPGELPHLPIAAARTARSGLRGQQGDDRSRYHAQSPRMIRAAIQAEWMKTMPLGKIEYHSPGGPMAISGNGQWATRRRKLGDSLFVQADQLTFAASPSRRSTGSVRRDSSAGQGLTAIINDPQGPLWYRGLISRGDGDEAHWRQSAGSTSAADDRAGNRPCAHNYGVKRIVVAIRPTSGDCSGDAQNVWRIDSGSAAPITGRWPS